MEGRVAERSPLSCSAPQATLITNVEARWRSPGTLHKNCYNTTIDAGALSFQTPAAPARAMGPRTGSFVRGHGPVSPPPSHVFGGILQAGCRRCPIARCGNRHSLMAVGRAVGVWDQQRTEAKGAFAAGTPIEPVHGAAAATEARCQSMLAGAHVCHV